nr:hypothetical protein [Tanacetum cinerariifolium]
MTLEIKNFLVISDPFGQPLDIGDLDDHVMVDELSAKGQYVGSSRNQRVSVGASRSCKKQLTVRCSRFASVGSVSGGNDHPAFFSAGVFTGDLQTQVAPLYKEKNDVKLKCNELQGMVLYKDGNIKLFLRELDCVSKERVSAAGIQGYYSLQQKLMLPSSRVITVDRVKTVG